jgi:hypothetical protein
VDFKKDTTLNHFPDGFPHGINHISRWWSLFPAGSVCRDNPIHIRDYERRLRYVLVPVCASLLVCCSPGPKLRKGMLTKSLSIASVEFGNEIIEGEGIVEIENYGITVN